MNTSALTGTLTLVLLAGTCLSAPEHKELKAFPAPKDGMKRVVIVLPHKERGEEGRFKVELFPGKELETDGVNQVRLGVSIEPRPLKGWGYTFYEVTGSPVVMSTLMAAPEGTPKVKKFVTGKPLMIRYNSRLPIVVYVPRDVEIQYRIWEAPEQKQSSEEG